MASGGHLLLQQKPALVGRIKTLINADLKEVCKAYGQPVSGNKAQLQTRCQEGKLPPYHNKRQPSANRLDVIFNRMLNLYLHQLSTISLIVEITLVSATSSTG